MNCRPGDLAITVGAPQDNGLIVEVSAVGMTHRTAGFCWVVTSLGSPFHFEPTERRHTVLWPDALLRPIGPRGQVDQVPEAVGSPA